MCPHGNSISYMILHRKGGVSESKDRECKCCYFLDKVVGLLGALKLYCTDYQTLLVY